ncbi:MAG: hypothetical protein J7521_07135 [Caulobacter sp.]|nr:hypothetical protein [Caulobacter sp.]
MMAPSPHPLPSLADLRAALDGLTPGDVPIATSKRLSTAIALNGQHYRIGKIWANRAFVVRRGRAYLLYVHVDYRGYRGAALRVFSPTAARVDYDHALGRAIAKSLGFTYVLMLRVPRDVNRSHGRLERPTPRVGLILKKTCLTDPRILGKMLGLPGRGFKRSETAYDVSAAHNPPLTEAEYRTWAFALGVDLAHPPPMGLSPISR